MSTAVLNTPLAATFEVPAGACDCHMHAYDDAYPLAPTATFKPPHAPMADYTKLLADLGLTRVVVVQPTGYGFDNRCTLAAVASMAGRARAVAMVPPDVTQATLQDLHEAGRKIESIYLRALNAEDEVGKATETIGERDLSISGLEIQISQLTMEIAHRETAILNAATHHIDDYDAIRTRVLRMLGTQVDLLTDGLHALRKDNREVAEEFMERTISSLNRELENLRISREVGD